MSSAAAFAASRSGSRDEGGGHSGVGRTPGGDRPRALRKSIGEALRVRHLVAADDGEGHAQNDSPHPPLLDDPSTPAAGPVQRLSSALLRARKSSGAGSGSDAAKSSGRVPSRLSGGITHGVPDSATAEESAPFIAEDASPPPVHFSAASDELGASTAGSSGGVEQAIGGPSLRLSGASADQLRLAAGRRSSGRRSSEGGPLHLRGARRVIATVRGGMHDDAFTSQPQCDVEFVLSVIKG